MGTLQEIRLANKLIQFSGRYLENKRAHDMYLAQFQLNLIQFRNTLNISYGELEEEIVNLPEIEDNSLALLEDINQRIIRYLLGCIGGDSWLRRDIRTCSNLTKDFNEGDREQVLINNMENIGSVCTEVIRMISNN